MSMTDTGKEPAIINEPELLAQMEKEQALANAEALARKGDKKKIRSELAAQAKKHKGTPKGTLYEFLGATEDYSSALGAAREQLKAEREAIEARARQTEEEAKQYPQGDEATQDPPQMAFNGQGGPELSSEDAAVEYAAGMEAVREDEMLDGALDAYEQEQGVQEAKVSPKFQTKPTATAAKPKQGEPPVGPAVTGGMDALTGVASVAGDIAVGFAESPGAILRGVAGGADELLESIDSASAWVAINGARYLGDEEGAKVLEGQSERGELVALGGLIDTPQASSSVTGNIIQGIAQFATGFVAGGKALKAAGLIGKGGGITAAFAKGAFADAFAFDPAQQRLSNLIESNPQLQNPVTEFLASKPGDSEAMGRFKNALEGMGIGGAIQGAFVMGLKGLRAYKAMNPPPPTPAQIQAQVTQGLAPIGNPSAPAMTVRKTATDGVTPEALTGYVNIGAKGDQSVFINMARIETADDVKDILQKSANLFKEEVGEAQRGVQSFEETAKLADDLGMSVEELLSRPRGPNNARTPFTAEEALAARKLYTASGEKLMELAQKAASPTAGPMDLFNFRKAMSVHHAIQAEVIGARTETARALSSWRIGAGSSAEQLRMIEQSLDNAGADSVALAKQLVTLQATGATPGAINKFVRQSMFGNVGEGLREVYVNGLLSGPSTHIVNAMGNFGTLALSAVERRVGAAVSRNATQSDAIASGEAGAMLWGMLAGQKDALRLAWKTLRTGQTEDVLGKVDAPRPSAIGSTRNDAFGVAVNAIGTVIRIPSLLMSSADQYFKAVNYRASLHALAYRQATSEGLTGPAFGKRINDILNNPPDSVKIESADAALYNTFNNKMGWFGQKIMGLREAGGPLVPIWLVATFIRTPVNIARYAFERTPLAPLVGQWRADFAAGGARRDMALARVATGTMIMGIAQQMVDEESVTGSVPKDANEAALWKRLGRQPYSVKVGDTWYSYNRADPFGMIMGFAADIQQTLRQGEVSPKDVDEWQEVMAAGISAVSMTALEKSFMRSYSDFNEMMSDPKRYAPNQINSILSSFVPFTSLMGAATRLGDATQRDARTPLDAIYAKIPGLADRVIPKRNLWGEAAVDKHGVLNVFNPMRASTETGSVIDMEMERLQVFPEGIGWKSSIDGVAIDFDNAPIALDEYRRLAGNGWKHPAWGLGLKDFLDQVVTGQHPMGQIYKLYSDGDQGGKAGFIRKAIQEYREGAGQALLNDPAFKDFRRYYDEEKAIQRQAKQKITLPN